MVSVERKAIQLVIKYEKSQGRKPKYVGKIKCGYDIKSGGRFIEVKGKSGGLAGDIEIIDTIVRKLGKDLANYYVYIVYDIDDEPKLKILEPDTVFKNLHIFSRFYLSNATVKKYGTDVTL